MPIIRTTDQGTHPEPSKEEARQGQNIKGMVTVLVVSLLLILAAYGTMLALFGGAEIGGDTSPQADVTSETGGAATQPPDPPPS